MFTGIVQGTGIIVKIEDECSTKPRTHWVRLPKGYDKDLAIGASVSHNGCCLSVVAQKEDFFSFHLIAETLKKTNLGLLKEGDEVNIERAAKIGDEIGGHIMSGHICNTISIREIYCTNLVSDCTFWFDLPTVLKPYIFSKGFIALNGCSLTVGEIKEDRFSVYLTPETLSRTTFKSSKRGELVNVEIDSQTQAIVDTVKRILCQNKPLFEKGSSSDHG